MFKTSSLIVLTLLFVSSSVIFTGISSANGEPTTTTTTESTTTTTIEETTTTTTSTTLPEETTTTTTQQPICSLSASDIAFGTLTPGSTSPNSIVSTVSNTGNMIITYVSISGTDWQRIGGGTPISVGQTKWSTTDTTYESMVSLIIPNEVPITPLVSSNNIFFKLNIPDNQPAGGYTQQITFTFECQVTEL